MTSEKDASDPIQSLIKGLFVLPAPIATCTRLTNINHLQMNHEIQGLSAKYKS